MVQDGTETIIQLSDVERLEHARLLMREQLEETSPSGHPTAILTGGQPGSGKSGIVKAARVRFEDGDGIVRIDPDDIRLTLPYMAPLVARGELEIPDAAYADAGTIAYQMLQIAKAERRNVVVDGTLQNTGRALGLADEMRKAGYGVEFHGMAVHPDLSHARTYTRREEQIAESANGFGRGVGDDFHDQAVAGYRDTVEAFQTRSAVDSMSFYGEGGKLVETKFSNGQWMPAISMGDELDRIQRNPDQKAKAAASDAWWTAAHKMRGRHAEPGEIAKVDSFRRFSALSERQLKPTSVSTRFDIAIPAGHGVQGDMDASRNADVPDADPTLADPRMLSIARLVHEGLRQSGRNADESMMMVTWTPDETYLDVKAPNASGRFERVTMPGHERIERALRGIGATGTLDVDFADPAAAAAREGRASAGKDAAALGITPADLGITLREAVQPSIDPQARQSPSIAAIAAMRAGRSLS